MTDAKPYSLGVVFIISTFIGTCCVHTASLRQYKISENEPDSKFKNIYRFASPDMLKALEYIESLRQQTKNGDLPDYDDLDQIRLLQNVPLYQNVDEVEGRNHIIGHSKDPLNEGETQLFQIMVDALKQAEEAKPAARGTKPTNAGSRAEFPKYEIGSDDYETYKWPEGRSRYLRKPKIPHDNYRDSLYKRTNEIIEEQYTPQNIATLESVFKELGRLAEPINLKKDRVDEQKLYKNDEAVNKVNNIAYEDEDGVDWNPVEEKIESEQTEEEEIVNSKENIDEDEDTEDDVKRADKQNFREEEVQVKDSRHPSSTDLPELISYLKGVMATLENSRLNNGQTEDKRILKPVGNEMDTQSIYQLLELSRELQIPPEDLIDMLQGGNGKKQSRSLVADDSTVPGDTDNVPKPDFDFSSKTSTKDNTENGSENQPVELTAEDILNLLGIEAPVHKNPAYHLKQNPLGNTLQPFLSSPNRRTRGQSLPKNAWIMDGLEKRHTDYPQINDEDGELAEYLVNMLAKYPDVLNRNHLKRTPTVSSSEDLLDDERNEQALKAYLNQAEPEILDKATSMSKRFSAAKEEEGASPNRHYLEEDMLRRMLEYLSKDAEENIERHTT